METQDLNKIDEIEYNGVLIPIQDNDIVRNADHHAVKFMAFDDSEYEVPLQGYNEQAGTFWALLWDQMEKVK